MKDEEFNKAIEWFNSLEPSKKAQAIEDPDSLTENERKLFFTIVRKVRERLATNDKEKVIQELKDLIGTYGIALIEKILKFVPPIEYSTRILNNLDKQTFQRMTKEYINSYFLGKETLPELSKRVGIDEEVLKQFDYIFMDGIFDILSGAISIEQYKDELIKHGLRNDLAESMYNVLLENESIIWQKSIYATIRHVVLSKIDDLKSKLDDLEKRVDDLTKAINELLELIRGRPAPSEMFG